MFPRKVRNSGVINFFTVDAVITTLLTPAQNLPSVFSTVHIDDTSVDNETDKDDETNKKENSDTGGEDDEPNFQKVDFTDVSATIPIVIVIAIAAAQ